MWTYCGWILWRWWKCNSICLYMWKSNCNWYWSSENCNGQTQCRLASFHGGGTTLKIFSAIYGVEDRIEFIVGDYFEIIQTLRPDVVFLSPPWGGPEYLDQETFDLANMSGLDGIKIFNDAAKLTKNIAYFVPRNTDGAALAKLAGEGGRKSI